MAEKSASEQIDNIIKLHGGWKGELLTKLRAVINEANPDIVEEIKWKMKTRPEGLPVWSHNGILCFVEIWNDNVKLLFPKGADLKDTNNLFNARLKSKDVRAIEFKQGDPISKAGIQTLVSRALDLNKQKSKNK